MCGVHCVLIEPFLLHRSQNQRLQGFAGSRYLRARNFYRCEQSHQRLPKRRKTRVQRIGPGANRLYRIRRV